MNRVVASSLAQPLLVVLMMLVLIGACRAIAAAPAGGCVSGPVAAHRRDHHAMAGAYGRGSGTADHGAGRDRHERHSESRQRPLDLAVWIVGRLIITFHEGAGDDYTRQQVFNLLPGPQPAERGWPRRYRRCLRHRD